MSKNGGIPCLPFRWRAYAAPACPDFCPAYAVGLQDTVEIGDFHGILSSRRALLKIAGQTTIVVGLRAKGSLDAPAYGQRREPFHLRWTGGDLHVEIMTRRGSVHALADVDPINLDALGRPSVLRRAIQQWPGGLRVVHIRRGHQHSEHEAERAGQDMALDPLDLLVAINAALALLRPRHNALRIKDRGGRLGGMAVLLAHRTRQHTAHLGPDPVVVKPVMPGSDRFPGAKVLGQIAPPATSLVQIQAGVDHLAHHRRQGLVNRKIRRNGLPLRIRQVAWVAPTVVLVAFTMFRRPHGMLLLLHQERATGGSDRCYTSTTVIFSSRRRHTRSPVSCWECRCRPDISASDERQ